MREPFGKTLSFGVLRKKRRVSGMMRAWNCNSLPDKNLSHVAAYTVLKYIIVSDSFRFLVKLWFPGKIICSVAKILRTLSLIERCAKMMGSDVLCSPVLLRHIFSSVFLPSSKDQGIIFES